MSPIFLSPIFGGEDRGEGVVPNHRKSLRQLFVDFEGWVETIRVPMPWWRNW